MVLLKFDMYTYLHLVISNLYKKIFLKLNKMKTKKNIKSFLREEDGKAIKKSLLISSLWLILWFSAWVTEATNSHGSGTWVNYHSSTHSNHHNHASY